MFKKIDRIEINSNLSYYFKDCMFFLKKIRKYGWKRFYDKFIFRTETFKISVNEGLFVSILWLEIYIFN